MGNPFGVAISASGRIYLSAVAGRAYRGSLATRTFDPPLVLPFAAADLVFTANDEFVLVAHQNSFAGPISVIDPVSNSISALVPTSFGLAAVTRDVQGNRAFFAMVNTAALYELRRVPDGGFTPDDGGYIAGFEGRVIPTGVGSMGTAYAGIAWDPGRQQLYAAHTSGNLVTVAPRDGGVLVTSLGAFSVRNVAYDASRDRVYVANEGGAFVNLQLPTYSTVPGGSPVAVAANWGLALTPDGEELWLTNSTAGTLTIFTLSTGATRSVTGLGRPRRIAFDATGQNAVIANEFGEALFFQ